MRYDVAIAGGGLSGLLCGLTLIKAGRRVVIICTGPGALQLNPGSIELLGRLNGQDVEDPIEAARKLPDIHPYQLLGIERLEPLAQQTKSLLNDLGLHMLGDIHCNHYRISPLGVLMPAWLTLEHFAMSPHSDRLPWQHVALMNIEGYLDFPSALAARQLERLCDRVDQRTFVTEEILTSHRSANELRAAHLSRVLVSRSALQHMAGAINQVAGDEQAVLLPAVLGSTDDGTLPMLRRMVKKPLYLLPTMPPTVPGVRILNTLQHYFMMMGGAFLSETVTHAEIADGQVNGFQTNRTGTGVVQAQHYVLATGSFMSRGLMSDANHIWEPVLGLDVAAPDQRDQWTDNDLTTTQPYRACGVTVNEGLHPMLNGATVGNLFAIGSVLAGHDAIAQGDGSGVSAVTALAVANDILRQS